MLTKMIKSLKKNPRTIVFPEGSDYRILDAAQRLTKEKILNVILLGNEEEIKAAAAKIFKQKWDEAKVHPEYLRQKQQFQAAIQQQFSD